MKVKMLTLMAGPDGINRPGDVIDVDTETADALIAANSAVDAEPPDEKTEKTDGKKTKSEGKK